MIPLATFAYLTPTRIRLIVADKRLVGPYNEGVFMDESFKTDDVKSGYRVGGTATWYRRALVTSTDPNNFTASVPVQADDWAVGTEQVFLDRVDFVQVHEATNSVEPRTSYVRWDNIANEDDKENIHISVSGLPVGETAVISIIAVGA